MKKYNFDQHQDRKNTDCIKYDAIDKFWGVEEAMPLWVADMDFATPDFIIDALRERLEHPVLGYSYKNEDHFKSISNWLKKRHNYSISPKLISGAPGVVAGLSMAIQEFTKPGDKIIIQPPVYFPFSHIVRDSGRKLVYNPLIMKDGEIEMDIKDLSQKIDSETRAILLCNPHNPGGRVWTKEELLEIDQLAQKHNLFVISDEIHADILFDGNKYVPYASISDYAAAHSISFGAPSKTFNIPGLATSFMMTKNPQIKERYDKVLELYHLQKGNVLGNIALTQAYTKGEEWLNQLLTYLDGNLELIEDFFRTKVPEIKVYRPQASFLVWLDCKGLGLDKKELKDFFFNQAGVILNPGESFGPGGEGFMRMNFALPREELKIALEKIQKAVKNFSSLPNSLNKSTRG